MARSAERISVALLVAVTPALLAGCVRTQDRSDWKRLAAQREIAGREPARVGPADPDVDVTAVTVLRGRTGTAVVVDLRSRAGTLLVDLPIRVGYRTRRGRRVTLRMGGWYGSHVAAIPPRGTTTFVATSPRRVPAGATPIVRVGSPPTPSVVTTDALPHLEVGVPVRGAQGWHVAIRNTTDVPQYDLQLVGVARVGGRPVAAGRASVGKLDGAGTAAAQLRLIGRTPDATPQVLVTPTTPARPRSTT